MGFLGAWWHGFPSRRLIVIGVTGTKGKTTTANLIWHILQRSGYKTGLATTVNFRVGERETVNESKQTMLGRFALQRMLRQMADEGCSYAVVETSSWGIAQYRHRFIDYRVAVLTNLTPEHIEQHGGFERYRAAKVRLFAHVARRPMGAGVYNLDDRNIQSFLEARMPAKFGYTLRAIRDTALRMKETVSVSDVQLQKDRSAFRVDGVSCALPLPGEFNVYNAAAAIATARSQGIALQKIADALRDAPRVAGRMEAIEMRGKPTVIIDYAHEPASLEAVYRAADIWEPKRKIAILGAQGGGRDVWKREAMGRVAARYLDLVILTNEDPYDDDPKAIMDDIEKGVLKAMRGMTPEVLKIVDRRQAIETALARARPGDIVLLTGKGGEVWMCVADGKKIPWDERAIVEEALRGGARPRSAK